MKHLFLIISSLFLFVSCIDNYDDVAPLLPEPKEKIIEMQTPYGKMYIWLFNATPLHKANFLKLAERGFYNQTTFHRIIPNFMIQGGDSLSKDSDPNNDGTGGPGYTIPNEIRDSIKHDRGSLAAARNNNPEKASSGSQFYIAVSKSGTTGLNGEYTVFGHVIKGIEFADSVVKQKRDGNNRPLNDIKMEVRVIEKTKEEIKTEFNYEAKL